MRVGLIKGLMSIATCDDETDAPDRFAKEAQRLLNYPVVVFLKETTGSEGPKYVFRAPADRALDFDQKEYGPASEGYTSLVLFERGPDAPRWPHVLSPNLEVDTQPGGPLHGVKHEPKRAETGLNESKSFVAVPIPDRTEQDAPLGVIRAASDLQYAFSRSDAETLRALASQVTVVLHRLEEARERDALFQTVVDTSPRPIIAFGTDGRIIAYNDAIAALLAIPKEDALDRQVVDIVFAGRRKLTNPASAVEDRPRVAKDRSQAARTHCWSAEDASAVMTAAKAAGPQVSAFIAVLLDTGCRKSEALGLVWSDVDLEAGTVTIARQLEPRRSTIPAWGPTKTGTARTVTLGPETIAQLKAHKAAQAALKMKNRTTYQDFGLVFAKQDEDLQRPSAALGQPCLALVGWHFRRVLTAAAVTRIKVHGTRHTCATLLLQAGVPVQVVAQRLGHADVTETLNTYAHATPNLQADAAARLGALLAGR